jgi:hypothetical protein
VLSSLMLLVARVTALACIPAADISAVACIPAVAGVPLVPDVLNVAGLLVIIASLVLLAFLLLLLSLVLLAFLLWLLSLLLLAFLVLLAFLCCWCPCCCWHPCLSLCLCFSWCVYTMYSTVQYTLYHEAYQGIGLSEYGYRTVIFICYRTIGILDMRIIKTIRLSYIGSGQSCESRRQTNSTCSRPRFREI